MPVRTGRVVFDCLDFSKKGGLKVPLAGLGGERRQVGIKGPNREQLFSALSSGKELEFQGEISNLPIKIKIRGISWEDGSGQSFNLECIGSSERCIRGYYDTRKNAGWLEYYQD